MKIDLFLGGPQGRWALAATPKDALGAIYTWDADIARTAAMLGAQIAFQGHQYEGLARGDVGFSVHYPKILRPEFISHYRKIYNIHPGYLPYGRGMYPVFWALWEQTPAGATLHEIDAGIDTGPIIDQIQVRYDISDTGKTLHDRIMKVERKLFSRYCPQIIADTMPPGKPQAEEGTYHSKADFYAVKEQSKLGRMRGKTLIRLIMALSFPGYTGLHARLGDKLFELACRELPL